MTPVVDIFEKLPDGSAMWIEAVDGLDKARARLKELNQRVPGAYFIHFKQHGNANREDQPQER